MDKIPLTKAGFDKLNEELRQLKSTERPNIIKAISEAREHGDLSENAEYDAAKEAQGLLEMKISKLKTVLANARVIDDSEIDSSKVFILSTVKIKNVANNQATVELHVGQPDAVAGGGAVEICIGPACDLHHLSAPGFP